MHIKYYLSFFSSLLFVVTMSGCVGGKRDKVIESPAGYDLNKPQRFKMSENLLEISGITFNNADPDTVYAIEDEDGRVYYFRPGDEKPAYTHFYKQGDYEDVAIMNGSVIVLKSNGNLYTFPLNAIKEEDQPNVREIKDILPEGEYEGLYADQVNKKLYVLCKNCDLDGGYVLNVSNTDSLTQAGSFSISMDKLTKKNGKKDAFRPSALAKNPVTGEWFITSANNNLLLITDGDFKAKGTYELPHSTFLQPEGIVFDKQANLYISNEGDELSNGDILKFTYSKSAKK